MPEVAAAFCALCQTAIADGEEATDCPGCAARYHRDCWDEVGGCGVYGCRCVPTTEKRDEMEIPAAFWGRETKPCPSCGQEIQAMAVRCRHCRAEFSAQTPQSGAEWRREQARKAARPALQQQGLWLAIALAVPGIALLALPVTGLWWWRQRDGVAALPRLRQVLLMIGAGLAAFQLLVLLIILLVAASRAS